MKIMRNIKYLLVIAIILTIFGQAKAFTLFRSEPTETRPISFLGKLIHERVNEERLKHNLPGLQWASDIAEVAQKHSEDMALKGYFAHENKEGELVSERLKKAGIVFTVSAENLFKCENYPDVVEESVTGWMQSSGHRENILNDKVEEAGVGVYKVSGKDEYYITQDFIKRALKFIPAPAKLSEEEIAKIFNLVKGTITGSDYRNLSLKERIVRKLINSDISVKRDFVVTGFLKEYPQLQIKVDLMVGNGFIVYFTQRELEKEKEQFGQLITSQGYSAIILIRPAKEKIEYVLIKSE